MTDTLPSTPDDWAFFLDIDGTLIDIAPTPDAVVVPPDLPGVLPEHLWPPLPTRRAPAPVAPDPVPALERRVRLTAEQAAT